MHCMLLGRKMINNERSVVQFDDISLTFYYYTYLEGY